MNSIKIKFLHHCCHRFQVLWSLSDIFEIRHLIVLSVSDQESNFEIGLKICASFFSFKFRLRAFTFENLLIKL